MTERPEMSTNDAFEGSLSPAQARAIDMLTAGRSSADVARELDVTAQTIYRWRQSPAFAAELRLRLEALREAARDRMVASTDAAVTALLNTLGSENDNARVAAARALLDRVGLEPKNPAPPMPAGSGEQSLTDAELRARVRRLVFAELEGLDPDQVVDRVRAVLAGEGTS